MPLQNRVTPLGDLIAAPVRGLVYGNRGCLHDDEGRIRRDYGTKRWIACRLRFRGRRRPRLMTPGRYTELFFLDDATALAAGHRPCAECRRDDYQRLKSLWAELHPGQLGADAIDAQLHTERLVDSTGRRFHDLSFDGLPDGAFVIHEGQPCVVIDDALLAWSPAGYTLRIPRPSGVQAIVITPPSLLGLLAAGWDPLVPLLHPTADAAPSAGFRGRPLGAVNSSMHGLALHRFDFVRLHSSLNERRLSRRISWAQVAAEMGVAASTIQRTGGGGPMEADGVRAMIAWLGKAPEDFVRATGGGTVPAAKIRTPPAPGKVRRFDTAGLYEALDQRRRSVNMSWRQVSTSLGPGVTPAMLTRLRSGGRIAADLMVAATGWIGASVEDLTHDTDQ